MTKWKKLAHNQILDGDNFYISFNPQPWAEVSMFSSDTGGAETALCKGKKFLILNGDFRKEYEEVFANGYEACLAIYEKNKVAHDSSWTSQD